MNRSVLSVWLLVAFGTFAGTRAAAHVVPDLNRLSPPGLQAVLRHYGWPSRLGERLLSLRDSLGGFEAPAQLALLPGIGKKWGTKLSRVCRITPGTGSTIPLLEKLALLRGQKPPRRRRVAINHAGHTVLAALPGLDTILAARIISWRRKFGSFAHPWMLLAVPGITPDRYGLLRRHIHTRPASLVQSRIVNRTQLGKKNVNETYLQAAFFNTVFVQLLYRSNFSRTNGQVRAAFGTGGWQAGYRGRGVIRFLTIGSFRMHPGELETGTLPQGGFSSRPRTFAETTLLSTNGTLTGSTQDRYLGGGTVVRIGSMAVEGFYSSSTFKALVPVAEDWLSEAKTGTVRLAGTGLAVPHKAGQLRLRLLAREKDGMAILYPSCTLTLARKNLVWGVAAGVCARPAPGPPGHAVLVHCRTAGRPLTLFMTGFHSSKDYLPPLEDNWGRSILPGYGAHLAAGLQPHRILALTAAWLCSRRFPEEKLYQSFNFSALLHLLPPLSLRAVYVRKQRGADSAQIWAPVGFRTSLRYTPSSGPQLCLEWHTSRARSGCANALSGTLAKRFSTAFSGRFWFAAGSPGQDHPLYLPPPVLTDQMLCGRACFSDFRALSLALQYRPVPALRLSVGALYYRDRDKHDNLLQFSAELRP